jgi:hypothetical protein
MTLTLSTIFFRSGRHGFRLQVNRFRSTMSEMSPLFIRSLLISALEQTREGLNRRTIHREPGSDQSRQGQIRRIGKSANQAATDLGSKSDQQNQIRLQSTRGRRTGARQYW